MINRQEYTQRRERLFAQMSKGSVAIVTTAPEYIRSADQYYDFFPDTDFYYLTGFVEPEAAAVLVKEHDGKTQFMLFCRAHDDKVEQWVGRFAGLDGQAANIGRVDNTNSLYS